jgi:hypothetical protein
MADVRSAWNETGDKLTELGRKLKVHYDTQHGGEADSQQTRDELTDAARKLGSAVQDAFEAIGAAARDRAVQDDVKHVGQSLAEALGATLGQAADELRRAFSERKGAGAATDTTGTGTTGTTEAEAGASEPLTGEPPATGSAPGTENPEDPPKVEPWGTP